VTEDRYFPPPWSVEELDSCFVVKDANGQALAYMYFEKEPLRRFGVASCSRVTRRSALPPFLPSCRSYCASLVFNRDAETTMKYTPRTADDVRRCLRGCSGETQVEVEDGIPVTAKTVADLRALSTWPPGDWVLDVPAKGDQQHSAVRVEWPSYTSL
jgi:hypothetical protein